MGRLKSCGNCKNKKPLDQFYYNKSKGSFRHRSTCKVCDSKRAKLYREKNRKKLIEYSREYNFKNPQILSESKKFYNKRNPHKVREWSANRRAAMQRIPLTQDMKDQIAYKYQLAKDAEILTGDFYEVDHIVPLKGKNVCGLHVPWNLQILPRSVNRSKHNKYASFSIGGKAKKEEYIAY